MSAARDAILARLGMRVADRFRPAVESTRIITSVEPYQAQLLNKWASGSLLVPDRPSASSNAHRRPTSRSPPTRRKRRPRIDIVEVRAVGRYGRFFVSGGEASVQTAMDAAVSAIDAVEGRTAP